MAEHRAASSAPALAACLAVIAAGAWQWQRSVFRVARTQEHLTMEAWEQVKTQYPLPAEPSPAPVISAELFDAVVGANPFSPQRRAPAGAAGGPGGGGLGGGGGTVEPPAPKFVYKGRINVGSSRRAIVEDTTAHKTYFLEVGQEVAGFKVLDIAEKQVVLSDSQSQQELVLSLASKSGP